MSENTDQNDEMKSVDLGIKMKKGRHIISGRVYENRLDNSEIMLYVADDGNPTGLIIDGKPQDLAAVRTDNLLIRSLRRLVGSGHDGEPPVAIVSDYKVKAAAVRRLVDIYGPLLADMQISIKPDYSRIVAIDRRGQIDEGDFWATNIVYFDDLGEAVEWMERRIQER